MQETFIFQSCLHDGVKEYRCDNGMRLCIGMTRKVFDIRHSKIKVTVSDEPIPHSKRVTFDYGCVTFDYDCYAHWNYGEFKREYFLGGKYEGIERYLRETLSQPDYLYVRVSRVR